MAASPVTANKVQRHGSISMSIVRLDKHCFAMTTTRTRSATGSRQRRVRRQTSWNCSALSTKLGQKVPRKRHTKAEWQWDFGKCSAAANPPDNHNFCRQIATSDWWPLPEDTTCCCCSLKDATQKTTYHSGQNRIVDICQFTDDQTGDHKYAVLISWFLISMFSTRSISQILSNGFWLK